MKIKIPDDVMFRVLGDEAVLLNLVTGTYFGLDDVGTRMWQILSEHESTDKVIETMLNEYDVEEGLLRSDLDKLINNLIENGLVKADALETPPSE
jgi:hypothetical protein